MLCCRSPRSLPGLVSYSESSQDPAYIHIHSYDLFWQKAQSSISKRKGMWGEVGKIRCKLPMVPLISPTSCDNSLLAAPNQGSLSKTQYPGFLAAGDVSILFLVPKFQTPRKKAAIQNKLHIFGTV